MSSVRNISEVPVGVRDKTQPGAEAPPDPVTVKPGKQVEVSAEKADELIRDYPEHFERA